MSKFAKRVTVDQAASKVFIDGEEFPWALGQNGIRISGLDRHNGIPTITLDLLAKDVEVLPRGEKR